jgi:predicted transport protein
MSFRYVKPERLLLVGHPELSERWVQDRIAEDPSILGLGELVLKDKERSQPRAGRLDLLLQDTDVGRYEVEVQLGPTDESHIIRTIEYWDIERKRYPQYNHTAVIVAEEITARFLNVISLFNGFIPLVAIQMQAFRIGDQMSLLFTTVLDQQQKLGLVDEDEGGAEPTDRAYWEDKGSKATVEMADQLLAIIHEFDPELALKYNKFYIGLARDGQPNNFVVFRPQRRNVLVELRLPREDDTQKKLEDADLEPTFDARFGKTKVSLSKEKIEQHTALLKSLMQQAHDR